VKKVTKTAKKGERTYLKNARLTAGYASRRTAAKTMPFRHDTIGRHERGEMQLSPEDMVAYAKHYRRKDILLRYCMECPVGRTNGFTVTERDLATVILRLTKELRKAASKDGLIERLEEIAEHGEMDEKTYPLLMEMVDDSKDLYGRFSDFFFLVATPPKKESEATEKGRNRHCNAVAAGGNV